MTHQENNDNDLVTQEVRDHVENLVDALGIANYSISITEGTTRGDNYLGIIAKALVQGIDVKSGQDVTQHFIIKSAPRKGIIREIGPLRQAYEREIYIYSDVFPEYRKLQEERGIEHPFSSYVKFYKSSMSDMNEALVMQDMKAIGYQMRSRFEPLNYEHVVQVVREYGKLHALSYALRDQKPKVFEELSHNLHETFMKSLMGTEVMKKHVGEFSERILKAFDPVKDEMLYKRVSHFQKNSLGIVVPLLEAEVAGIYGVIGHGDSWVNNMLFKYENPNITLKPTQMCFLDWQLARIGSPALDLSYFLFTCTDKKLRDEHYHSIIKEYYDSLSIFLGKLGGNPDTSIPFEVLQEHLKKFSVYGLYMAMMALHLMMSEVDEIPDIHDISIEDIEGDLSKFKFESKNAEKYNIRIRDIVLDFVKFDYDF